MIAPHQSTIRDQFSVIAKRVEESLQYHQSRVAAFEKALGTISATAEAIPSMGPQQQFQCSVDAMVLVSALLADGGAS